MKPLFIIDGYNMIRRIEALRAHETKSLEGGRNALLVKLSVFRSQTQSDIMVVFDGKKTSLSTKNNITIHFSNLPNKADEQIKRLVDAQVKGRSVTVVSSDNEVMWYAKGCGCKVERSEEFYPKLLSQKKPATAADVEEKGDPHLSDKDMDYWMKMFSK